MPILLASPQLKLRGRPTAPAAKLDDAAVKAELITMAIADSLEANSNLPASAADALRGPALDRLFPDS